MNRLVSEHERRSEFIKKSSNHAEDLRTATRRAVVYKKICNSTKFEDSHEGFATICTTESS